ncbi:hypothetical protein ACJX0J_038980 [Zea mays]
MAYHGRIHYKIKKGLGPIDRDRDMPMLSLLKYGMPLPSKVIREFSRSERNWALFYFQLVWHYVIAYACLLLTEESLPARLWKILRVLLRPSTPEIPFTKVNDQCSTTLIKVEIQISIEGHEESILYRARKPKN